jgi:hypothetical protein
VSADHRFTQKFSAFGRARKALLAHPLIGQQELVEGLLEPLLEPQEAPA